jgi:hypothetical protein
MANRDLPGAVAALRPDREAREPRHYTQKMKAVLGGLSVRLRRDVERVDEPRLKAMFETSAEVLDGLIKAFDDYEKKNEPAWRR